METAVGECVLHIMQAAEAQWQSILQHCSARRRRLEGVMRGLEELQHSMEEIQREIEEAQGVNQSP